MIGAAVFGGFVLDLLFGDPAWLPHPVVYMGRAISALEQRLRARLPRTPQGELLAALARADVGYVGMLCDLMLSNKLVEYVATGVPAVVARWPTFARCRTAAPTWAPTSRPGRPFSLGSRYSTT